MTCCINALSVTQLHIFMICLIYRHCKFGMGANKYFALDPTQILYPCLHIRVKVSSKGRSLICFLACTTNYEVGVFFLHARIQGLGAEIAPYPVLADHLAPTPLFPHLLKSVSAPPQFPAPHLFANLGWALKKTFARFGRDKIHSPPPNSNPVSVPAHKG